MFKGSIVALITPFKKDKLDVDSYISFFFAVIIFVSWSTVGFFNGNIRSAAIDFDEKMIKNVKKIMLSVNKFIIILK